MVAGVVVVADIPAGAGAVAGAAVEAAIGVEAEADTTTAADITMEAAIITGATAITAEAAGGRSGALALDWGLVPPWVTRLIPLRHTRFTLLPTFMRRRPLMQILRRSQRIFPRPRQRF